LEKQILLSLDFISQLSARLVCSNWNNLLKPEIGAKGVLHVRHPLAVRDCSPVAKSFFKGEWDKDLMAHWGEIYIHQALSLPSKTKANGLLNYSLETISHLTIFEGDHMFEQFIYHFIQALPNVRHINLREHEFWYPVQRYEQSWGSFKLLHGWHTYRKTWRQGLHNLSNLTTFRSCLYDLNATLIYLKLLIAAGCRSLTLIDVDLSRTTGQPLHFKKILKLYRALTNLVCQNSSTLECLRIKWNHRVDTEADYALAMDNYDPFSEFLVFLSPSFKWHENLNLRFLILNFPVANLADGRVEEYLVPFLQTQTKLQRFSLSRVRWNRAFHRFISHFPRALSGQHEYSLYMRDVDAFLMGSMPIVYAIRGIEFLNLTNQEFNTKSIVRCRHVRSTFGRHICKRLPVVLLRVTNAKSNDGFSGFDVLDLVQEFPHLHELELLDNAEEFESPVFGDAWSLSNSEFNIIVSQLKHLRSLKVSKLHKLTDSGICCITWEEMEEIKSSGVCSLPIETERVAMFEAKSK